MPNKKKANNEDLIQTELQVFAEDYLTRTSYGDSDPKYQEQQLTSVISCIRELHHKYDLGGFSFDCIDLIPDVVRSHIWNIGKSATNCLQLLTSIENRYQLDEILISITKDYLIEVTNQAKQTSQEVAEGVTTTVSPEKMTLDSLQEHIKELRRIQGELSAQLEKTRKLDEQAALDAESAKRTLSEANVHLFEVQKALDTANEKATNAVNSATEAEKQATAAKTSADNAETTAKNAKTTADAVVPNMLAVLGIFVGIIIAIVACYLSVILAEQLDSKVLLPLPVMFLRYLVMGHIALATIFLLLYLIAKLTSHSMTNRCNNFALMDDLPNNATRECDKCKYRCSSVVRFRLQYTYIFAINVCFIIGYVVLIIWQIINVYFRSEFDRLITACPPLFWIIFAFGLLALFIFLSCIFFQKKKTK